MKGGFATLVARRIGERLGQKLLGVSIVAETPMGSTLDPEKLFGKLLRQAQKALPFPRRNALRTAMSKVACGSSAVGAKHSASSAASCKSPRAAKFSSPTAGDGRGCPTTTAIRDFLAFCVCIGRYSLPAETPHATLSRESAALIACYALELLHPQRVVLPRGGDGASVVWRHRHGGDRAVVALQGSQLPAALELPLQRMRKL